ncbi:MAG: MBL fold metallo-hydrolase [Bacteroidetes bacterium]|nr:MBL fold metallo-hydrolase [Bacteroidota bacterium]MDA1119443.1 MBL fold metallo-hydrolase [Bacteroidota bacterium]
MIQIKSFEFNDFAENTYILYDETCECVIIDPGCYNISEKNQLQGFIEDRKLKVVKLLNTHCHIDHVLGNAFVKETYDVSLIIHPKDEVTLEAVKVYAPVYGFNNYEEAKADGFMVEGDQLTFGSSILNVIFVPGHAPGHVAFVSENQQFCIGGDVLFLKSIGRTDLPGGDLDTLIESIHQKMFILDDATVVYPGHGPTTKIGAEKLYNPYCAIATKRGEI